MNYLVFLDAGAGELEKILSGTKSMLLKEVDPAQPAGQALSQRSEPVLNVVKEQAISPGDSLYFLRNNAESALRVKASVVHVRFVSQPLGEDLSHILKELQPRLQLTEDQYNHWSVKTQVMLVEFEAAHKIDVIQVAPNMSLDRAGWIAFDDLSLITV
jgi:hypothetical protein